MNADQIYDILSKQDFYDFYNNDDSIFVRHIQGFNEPEDKVCKKEVLHMIERFFKLSQQKEYVQFEYDSNYFGGNYDKVGNFTYIPLCYLENKNEKQIHIFFEDYTGISKDHIVHYTLDEIYDKTGELINV